MRKVDLKYCMKCGHRLEEKTIQGITRIYCPYCHTIYYDNPIPSVAIMARNADDHLLLVKRKVEPKKGFWALPGGFMDGGELATQAALREMKEETGLDGKVNRIIDIYSHESRMYGHVIIIVFEVEIIGGQLAAGDDAECASFFRIDQLPHLAFQFQEEAVALVIGHSLHRKVTGEVNSI